MCQVRNLRRISWSRIILWWLLALSGIPLHLLYNSVVFSTLTSREYTVFVGSESLVNGSAVDWSQTIPHTQGRYTLQHLRSVSTWQTLSNHECISTYGQPVTSAHTSARGDLLAITSYVDVSHVPAYPVDQSCNRLGTECDAHRWICAGKIFRDSSAKTEANKPCNINKVLKNATQWELLHGFAQLSPVKYCLSQSVEERCRVQFSLVIMIIVICANFVKILCMLLLLWHHKSRPLVTLGDALESFLRDKDQTTERMCLYDILSFRRNTWDDGILEWEPKRWRWLSSISQRRWLTCNML